MSASQVLSKRITMVCTLAILCISFVSGIVYVLPMIGKLTLGPHISWINYLLVRQTIWRVPIQFYIAIIAIILLTVHRSTSWSMVCSTVLFSTSLGMIFRNPYNIPLWITVVASVTALCASSASFEGGIKVFLRELFGTIKQLRQQPTSIWKMVAAMFAVAFVINYIHNEIVTRTSEEARDARLVEWYKDARNKTVTTDGIELKIFTDYQCPACSQQVPKYLETVLKIGSNTVRVELRDYPLDAACNDSSMSSLHPAACSAAYAVRLVDKELPDKVSNFRSWLYSKRSDLNDEIILKQLEEIGVSRPHDMFNDEIKHAVHADLQEAKAYGLGAVPSVVLNNVLLPAGLNPSKLELLLKSEI